jgi:hypothetical protein
VRLPNWPMPKLMNNHGNFIVSLGDVCRALAQKAEALGVEIYPGFAGVENDLFVRPNTMMVFGDAKKTLAQIAAAVKNEG